MEYKLELIANDLVKFLTDNGLTITTAESCTGGMIASAIVNIPGASGVFNEGYVTYSNDAKMKLLDVNKETLDRYGAVSEQTAREMAFGAVQNADADCAIVSTGIAGPDGGLPDKPVGTVYVGLYFRGEVNVTRCHFDGDRSDVRWQTTVYAISQMCDMLNAGL